MAQSTALSLPEALIYVERAARELSHGKLPLIQPAVMKVLERDGSDVQAKGIQTEVALFSALIMSLVFFERCNAIIVTESEQTANSFIDKPLFTEKGPKGSDFAARCGKTLKLIKISPDLEHEAESALNDYNTIPVVDLNTICQLSSLSKEKISVPIQPKKESWWSRFISRSPVPSSSSLLEQGLFKLNCAIKLFGDIVVADSEVGADSIILFYGHRS